MVAIEELKRLEPTYAPNAEVADRLSQKSVTALVGPFLVGKTSLMVGAEKLDEDIAMAGTITTRNREPRDDFGTRYTYLRDTETTRQLILDDAIEGNLVQYAVHPTTEKIYASRLEDYPKPFAVIDIVSSVIEPLSQIPWADFQAISVVCPPQQWRARFAQRAVQTNMQDIIKRLTEAKDSLEWSLSHDDMPWLNNPDGELSVTAAKLVDFIKREDRPPQANRKIAETLLVTVNNLL